MLTANKLEMERLWLDCIWSAGLPGAQDNFWGMWKRNLKITLLNATAKSCLAMLTQQNRDCKLRHSFLSSAVTTALLCSPPCLKCLREGSGVNKETGLSEKQTSSFTEQARVLFGLLVLF